VALSGLLPAHTRLLLALMSALSVFLLVMSTEGVLASCVLASCTLQVLHGGLPPFASPASVAVLGWYSWAVLCSHVSHWRLCACVSPSTITSVTSLCFIFLRSRLDTHSPFPLNSFHPDDDVPNDARRAPMVVRRSTLDMLNSAPNRR
jgi:hypothetical protein